MTTISPHRFGRSVKHAARGLRQAWSTENNFRIHVVIAIVVLVAILLLPLTPIETALIIFVIATVLILELVNTVVERFVNLLEPRVHPYVGVIKDLLAAAVLVVSIAAIFIGLLVLIPAFQR